LSEFHYVRTLGVDGGVDACEGPAIGLDLETVLSDGLPPWNISIEIIAAMCEILDISAEDGEVHGELHPKYVFIDETGAVSIEGFGVPRNKTYAPEGSPRGEKTDLYGLGFLAYACVSPTMLPVEGLDKEDPDAHDDAVIDNVLEVDLTGLPEEMQGDLQWFIAKLVSFDREDRPTAVDAWRTFIAFASEMDGPDMAEWCAAALDGGGQRRQVQERSTQEEEEDLGGPVMAKLSMSHEVNFETGGSIKGGATAFWTKADMKKALERDQADDDEGPPMGIGGGSATNFWSKDQLAAMAQGGSKAPRPKRSVGEGKRRRETAASQAPGTVKPSRPGRPAPENRTAPPPQAAPESFDDELPTDPAAAMRPEPPPPQPPPPQAPPEPPPARTPPAARRDEQALSTNPVPELDLDPTTGRRQVPPGQRSAPPPPYVEEEGEGGGLRLALLGGSGCAVGAAVLLVVGVVLLVVVALALNTGSGGIEEVPDPVPLPVPGEATDVEPTTPEPGDPAPADPDPAPVSPKPSPTPSPKPTSPKPSPSPKPVSPKPSPSPSPSPSPRPRPRPKPKPPPAPVSNGDARVSLRTGGRGKVLVCLDSAKNFDGPTSFVIEQWRLPANCLVQIDGAKGILQVSGSGTTTCDKQGDGVVCSPSSLP